MNWDTGGLGRGRLCGVSLGARLFHRRHDQQIRLQRLRIGGQHAARFAGERLQRLSAAWRSGRGRIEHEDAN